MKEGFDPTPPAGPEEEKPKHQPPRDLTRHTGMASDVWPTKKGPPRPDVSIDLNAPDAIDKLEKLEAHLRPTEGPDLVSEASEEVTEEDERELEAALKEAEGGEAMHFFEACQEAARHLFTMRMAGYTPEDIERAAKIEAEKVYRTEKAKPSKDARRVSQSDTLKLIKTYLLRYGDDEPDQEEKPDASK